MLIICTITTTMSSQSNTKCNCCTEKHSEFDFWIGSWTVTNPMVQQQELTQLIKYKIIVYCVKTG